MTSQFSDMTSSSNFLTLFCFSYQFSYCSKFHVNIITASGVMTISFYKGLTRNLKSEISPSEFAQYLEDGTSKEYQIWHDRL